MEAPHNIKFPLLLIWLQALWTAHFIMASQTRLKLFCPETTDGLNQLSRARGGTERRRWMFGDDTSSLLDHHVYPVYEIILSDIQGSLFFSSAPALCELATLLLMFLSLKGDSYATLRGYYRRRQPLQTLHHDFPPHVMLNVLLMLPRLVSEGLFAPALTLTNIKLTETKA